jgi:hypothetical protein
MTSGPSFLMASRTRASADVLPLAACTRDLMKLQRA